MSNLSIIPAIEDR